MTNEEMLLNSNDTILKKSRIIVNKGMIVYKYNQKWFDYNTLKDIVGFLNYIHKRYKGMPIPISFELGDICFVDKLVYVLFECICHSLIEHWKQDVYVQFVNRDMILTEGISSSPLLLLKTGEKRHIDKYLKKYNYDSFKNHYRRIIDGNLPKDSAELSIIMTEIDSFLKIFSVKEECRDEISEVISELVGNAGEHAGSDCLIDIDISPNYRKKGNSGHYYGVNLVVLNFSGKLLGTGLEEKILGDIMLDPRHEKVKDAYYIHSKAFSEDYTKEDFFNIASFQTRVSEREETKYTGGTGLTKLIKSLEQRSDAHRCYVISGKRCLNFERDYLEYNSENWIGFNEEKDFLNYVPELTNLHACQIFIPGTVYNLNFVMKVEDNND